MLKYLGYKNDLPFIQFQNSNVKNLISLVDFFFIMIISFLRGSGTSVSSESEDGGGTRRRGGRRREGRKVSKSPENDAKLDGETKQVPIIILERSSAKNSGNFDLLLFFVNFQLLIEILDSFEAELDHALKFMT